MALLEANWRAVEALAAALVDHRRIEGRQVERIIDRSMVWARHEAFSARP